MHKSSLIIFNLALAAICLLWAWMTKSEFSRSLAINLATTFFAIGWGIITINIYLERSDRRAAVRPLLSLSHESIARLHNTLLDTMWARFGREPFGRLLHGYQQSGGKPMAISAPERREFYDAVKSERAKVIKLLDELDQTLEELSWLVGWNLDARVLGAALTSRKAIQDFRQITFDDTEPTQLLVLEHILDADISAQVVRARLMKMVGITDGEEDGEPEK